jgi:hypothetical protein
MMSRVVLGVVLAVVMLVVGPSTYLYLGSKTSKVATPPAKPTEATPRSQAFSLPGTMYLEQAGALYSFSAGRFHQLTPEQGWMQPALLPDGSGLIAVKRANYYADVYTMNSFGTVTRQLTSNRGRIGMADPSSNHWSFYPRLSADGKTLWMTYDGNKCTGCLVIMFDIWAMPYGGNIRQARLWTRSNLGTGGDVQPIPVPGGVIYTKYDYDAQQHLAAQLWFTRQAGSVGKALTNQSEDCRTPSLSPDGKRIAMICTYDKQVSYLAVASWNGSTIGPRQLLITDQLVAQPTWAPDGSGIAYLAPGVDAGPFQLWFLPRAAYAPVPSPIPSPTPGGPHNGPVPSPTPAPAVVVKPIQLTTNNGFDATSPIAWR